MEEMYDTHFQMVFEAIQPLLKEDKKPRQK
jgi:hypothetical protein